MVASKTCFTIFSRAASTNGATYLVTITEPSLPTKELPSNPRAPPNSPLPTPELPSESKSFLRPNPRASRSQLQSIP